MRRSKRSLIWPLAGATLVHGLLGWSVLARSNAAPPGLRTVLAISLIAPAAPLLAMTPPAPAPAPSSRVDTVPAAVAVREVPVVPQPASDAGPAADDPGLAAALPSTAAASALPRVAARSEHFYRANELSRLPGLPGEPLIDLGADAQELAGSVALQLFIDETGRVVDHRIESAEGLPAAIVEKLTRAFAGYPYIAGQLQGQSVKSQVTLAISVRDGMTAMGRGP